MDNTEELRVKVLVELKRLELLKASSSKKAYRSLHLASVRMHLQHHQAWIQANFPRYARYLANGKDVIPSKIKPCLVEVDQQWQADVFRLARLSWSLPFSKGYGRRNRFIIFDSSNEKVIGIIGLQSPPLDFAARDKLFTYPQNKKVDLVNQTMDVYTLGALPPYNYLLGGKLVALAAASNEVRAAYQKRYEGKVTQMEGKILPAQLVALTTTSAFGKSSIYNRLRYQGRSIAESLGYTEGFGSFHLATLYPELRKLLDDQGIPTQGGFGVGPRIVWQTMDRALRKLGFSKSLLKHGLKREAFLFRLTSNLESFMKGEATTPEYYDQSFDDLSKWWIERWLLPRSDRVTEWQNWQKQELQDYLFLKNLTIFQCNDAIEDVETISEELAFTF